MQLRYKVKLTERQRNELISLINTGKEKSKKLTHARVLLQADCSRLGPAKKSKEIGINLHIHERTVRRIRERFVVEGLEAALNGKPHRSFKPRKLDGEQEAHLIALCCSQTPQGRKSWTLKLLSEQLVELNVVERVSRSTVQRTLKKMNLSHGEKKNGVFQQ